MNERCIGVWLGGEAYKRVLFGDSGVEWTLRYMFDLLCIYFMCAHDQLRDYSTIQVY